MITLRFACGHQLQIAETNIAQPPCPQCGETRIQGVTARPPTFRGACSGPLVKEG